MHTRTHTHRQPLGHGASVVQAGCGFSLTRGFGGGLAEAAGLRPPHDERNNIRWPPAKRRGAGGSHARSPVASQRNHHQEDPPSTAECHCVRNPNKAQRSCAQRTPTGHNRMCVHQHTEAMHHPSPRHPTSLATPPLPSNADRLLNLPNLLYPLSTTSRFTPVKWCTLSPDPTSM